MNPRGETIGTLIEEAARHLRAAGIETPRREAAILLAHGLGLDAASMRLRDRHRTVGASDRAKFHDLVARRATRAPLAHVTGTQGFWTLDLAVSDATLIPRADSEVLIDSLLALRPGRAAALRMLDLGTGTGCLLLAALSEYPRAWGIGVDRSPRACALAAANARTNGLDGRSAFLCGCWSEALVPDARRFDLVLSNPPYVRSADIVGLMPEVARFEPALALDGGADGLDAYRTILSGAAGLLADDGLAIVEIGVGQLDQVGAIAAESKLVLVSARSDLGGAPRAIVLRRP